jgi:DNA-binding MarR family transcriptional regulator
MFETQEDVLIWRSQGCPSGRGRRATSIAGAATVLASRRHGDGSQEGSIMAGQTQNKPSESSGTAGSDDETATQTTQTSRRTQRSARSDAQPLAGPAEGDTLTKLDYERLAELRHALRRFSRHTELEARHLGISPQQYVLLLAIKGFPGRDWANITELAERLQVRHNAVIGLVNRAEARGLVVRVQDADRSDRRVVQIRLTEMGERTLQVMAEALRSERARVRTAMEAAQGLSATEDM